MDAEQILKIKESIQNLRSKNSRIYFFVHDTKEMQKHQLNLFMIVQ